MAADPVAHRPHPVGRGSDLLLYNHFNTGRDRNYQGRDPDDIERIRIIQEGLNQCGGACDFCNGCDNLGGGSVDTFYELYINGEKELRQLNEEYRSNMGLVR